MDKPRIGYVGVGLMGLPMARRLRALGYPVRVFDIVPAQLDLAREVGATLAGSPAEAALGADLVLLNLPTPAAVEAAVFDPGGVASALQSPQLVIDFSTIKVEQGQAETVERSRRMMADSVVHDQPAVVGLDRRR